MAMIEKLVETRTIRPAAGARPIAQPETRRAPGLSFPLYAMQLILAYEWLLSGIDKVADPNFGAQLPATLRGSTLVNPYGWYSSLLKQIVLPNVSLVAPLVELGELAIGVILIVSGALWLWRPRARMTLYAGYLACLTLFGALLLSLNYSFQQGTPLPWINGNQALSPGVGIDMLIALLSIPLLAANILAIRRRRSAP
jgi:thiosulfate dehydrogenase [quinone] large subunit